MNLLTLDEARQVVVTSAWRLLRRGETRNELAIAAMLCGAGALEGLSVRDRVLAERHRRVLDEVIALGYGAEAADELAGISSAQGFDADSIDPTA
jgi:hypothetical protein